MAVAAASFSGSTTMTPSVLMRKKLRRSPERNAYSPAPKSSVRSDNTADAETTPFSPEGINCQAKSKVTPMANMDFFIILQPLTHALIEDETRNPPHIKTVLYLKENGVEPHF
jgi:hypothetical protein